MYFQGRGKKKTELMTELILMFYSLFLLYSLFIFQLSIHLMSLDCLIAACF